VQLKASGAAPSGPQGATGRIRGRQAEYMVDVPLGTEVEVTTDVPYIKSECARVTQRGTGKLLLEWESSEKCENRLPF